MSEEVTNNDLLESNEYVDCPHIGMINDPVVRFAPNEKYEECSIYECSVTSSDDCRLFLCYDCSMCLCDVHANEHSEKLGHPVHLDLKDISITCRDCKKSNIDPKKNILRLSLPFIAEYMKKWKKYPSVVCLPRRDFGTMYKNESHEFIYLFDRLFELLCMGGRTGDEKKVKDYIRKQVNQCNEKRDKEVESNIFDESYGIFLSHDSKSTSSSSSESSSKKRSHNLLLNAHIDRVAAITMKPCLIKDKNGTVMGTGFDNRVSVAVLLTILRFFHPCERLRLFFLFDTKEESGFDGFRDFFQEEKIIEIFGKTQLDEINVLDVTYGRMATGECPQNHKLLNGKDYPYLKLVFRDDIERVPKIGSGICVKLENEEFLKSENYARIGQRRFFVQSSGIEESKDFNQTNLQVLNEHGFRQIYKYKIQKGLLSVPVVDMHGIGSFASVMDIWKLYVFLKSKLKVQDSFVKKIV